MKKKLIQFFLLSVPLAFNAQVISKQKQTEPQFSEMTTLEQFGGPATGSYNPTKEEKERIAWFRNDKFGMFIHWGLYSIMEGYWKGKKVYGGEWALKGHKLPIEEYRELAKEFNPAKYNADQWVSLAKSAGMKYIVVTAKHHDGFAMFKSTVSSYNVVDATPFKRDVMRELKDACDRQGIKFGVYYSHAQDWNEPDGYGNNWSFNGYKGDMDAYLNNKGLPQLAEICRKYQPAVIWFDTPGAMTLERAQKVADLARSITPNVLLSNRIYTGKDSKIGRLWDYSSGGDNKDYPLYSKIPWEYCGIMNNSWGYKKWDTDFVPTSELINVLVNAVSKNGNYLLNIAPNGDGEITEPYIKRLQEMGGWLKVNGEAIYGCGGTAFGTEFGEYTQVDGKTKFVSTPAPWRCTTKKGSVYIHILNWPKDGQLKLPALKSKIKNAVFLADTKAKIEVKQTTDFTVLKLPNKAPDDLVSVLRLSI
ncbi:alpha-L-fucosidase [Flavobacterium sp. FlaQc-48]|uniref:alpha-L-fucosidase n=1 Tax=Flavobacterium sp. FlaQc-48 TaxID=3374181 RepID=UPI00375825A8